MNISDTVNISTALIYRMGDCILVGLPIFLIIFVIVIGNTLVIVAISTDRKLRKQYQNWLIISLAVADLVVGLIVMPLTFSLEIYGEWVLGRALCQIWLALDVLFVTASISNMCAISLDRYWSVTDPIRYQTHRSAQTILKLIFGAWAIALAISLPPLVGWRNPANSQRGICALSQNIGYVLYSSLGSFFIPVIILMCVYTKIYMVTRKRIRTKIRNVKAQEKTLTSSAVEEDYCPHVIGTKSSDASKHDVIMEDDFSLCSDESTVTPVALVAPVTTVTVVTPTQHHVSSRHGLATSTEHEKQIEMRPRRAELRSMQTDEMIMQSAGQLIDIPGAAAQLNVTTTKHKQGIALLHGDGTEVEVQVRATETESVTSVASANPKTSLRKQATRRTLWTNSDKEERVKLLPVRYSPFMSKSPGYRLTGSGHSRKCTLCCVGDLKTPLKGTAKRSLSSCGTFDHNGCAPKGKAPSSPVAHAVFQQIKKKRREMKRQERKSTLILGLLLFAFIACWFPFFTMYILQAIHIQIPQLIFDIFFWIGYCNSGINPIIYSIFNVQFRKAFIRILKGSQSQ